MTGYFANNDLKPRLLIGVVLLVSAYAISSRALYAEANLARHTHGLVVSTAAQVAADAGSASGVNRVAKVFNADAFQGSDFSFRVNACLETVIATGGGTCDARNFPTTNFASQSITVGDGANSVTLLLPAGTILFANGKQLIYRSRANILGQGIGFYKYHGLPAGSGSTLYCAASTAMCVVPFNEPSNVVEYAHLAKFSIQSGPISGIPTKGSVGLAIGGGTGGADVASSRFELLRIGGFDVGTQMGGAYGCTCYNDVDQVYSTGKSYGISTVNVSKFFGDVNSNSWSSGTAWGAIGLSDVGGSKNRWIGIDIEGAKIHGMVISGYGSSVISPYEEGNGCDLINGTNNMLVGPLSYGGGAWRPCAESTSQSGFWWGPDAAPRTIGTTSGIVFGSPKMYDDGYNSQYTLLTGNALDLKYSGNQITVYGRNGHAPLHVGNLEAMSGITATGKSSLSAIPDEPAPMLLAVGGTGTNYTYYVVGYDRNGGTTLPSRAATVSGPPLLGTVLTTKPKIPGSGYVLDDLIRIIGNSSDGDATARVTAIRDHGAVKKLVVIAGGFGYASLNAGSLVTFATSGGKGTGLTVTVEATNIKITPVAVDGIHCVDVLKADTAHMLPSTIGDVYGCSVHNALPSRFDFGQATLEYKAPLRNNTGDLSITGQTAAAKYCFGGSAVCWTTTPGSPTGACVNGSINSSTSNGAFYVCQSKAWVEK